MATHNLRFDYFAGLKIILNESESVTLEANANNFISDDSFNKIKENSFIKEFLASGAIKDNVTQETTPPPTEKPPVTEKPVEKQTKTIIFNANGGSGKMDNIEATLGKWRVVENKFSAPKDKQFKHWNEKADGKGTAHEVGKELELGTTNDLTLYAIWEAAAPKTK